MPISSVYKIENLLTKSGWVHNSIITTDDNGKIRSITGDDNRSKITNSVGWLIPGFQNAHSHGFQYAMAGLAENLPQGAKGDDFWSWRNSMYELAIKISPDELEAVATMLYTMMLKNGITQVVEFHYLHHDKIGCHYSNLAEMGSRMIAAAKNAGIGITLIPIFYQLGGFNTPAEDKQKRFLSKTSESYLRLLEATENACKDYSRARHGAGIHSLRAVKGQDIVSTLEDINNIPIHIHIAEQQKEVQDCIDYLELEPIAWLLDNVKVSDNFHLVHATHMQDGVSQELAKTGASVVVCPATEGNLGDGFFRLEEFRRTGGGVSIGTDSNISLSPMEDLRWLDYGQRLKHEKRNTICLESGQDSGNELFKETWERGRLAAGLSTGEFFEVGEYFDGVELDTEHPIFIGKPKERILSALIYGGDLSCFKNTINSGEHIVSSGDHRAYAKTAENFKKTMNSLLK
jgi:formimidoylglutamate deiminase